MDWNLRMEIGRRVISVVSKRGKNKDSFGKKQYFFLFFVHPLRTERFPAVLGHPKPLLNKGFNCLIRTFERFFPLAVEPPFRRRFFHQRIDVAHAHQIPDAP